MMPFVLNEVANDVIDGLPQEFPTSQHALDCLRDPTQTFSAPTVIGRKIADLRGHGKIARLQLLEYHILQRMVIGIGIDLEIGDNRVDNLVVGAPAASEDGQLSFKNEEQPLDIAMLLAQNVDDCHCVSPN